MQILKNGQNSIDTLAKYILFLKSYLFIRLNIILIYRISDLGTFKIPLIYFIKKTKNIFIFIRNTNNTNYPLFQGNCEQSICMVGQSMSCQDWGKVWVGCGQNVGRGIDVSCVGILGYLSRPF